MIEQLILGFHLATVHDGNHAITERECQSTVWTKPDHHGKTREVPCGTRVVEPAPNNDTPGIYVRHAPTGFGVGFVHRNSERRESFRVDWTHNVWRNLDLTLGGATGYQRASVVPIVAPSLRFTVAESSNYAADVRIVYLPGLAGARDALHLAAEWRFK